MNPVVPSTPVLPKRGEIWWVNFAPSVGAEIKKVRPALVISLDAVGTLPLRIIVPLTSWQEEFTGVAWMRKVEATAANGLKNASAADAFQPRSFSLDRFQSKIGTLPLAEVQAIATLVGKVVGARP